MKRKIFKINIFLLFLFLISSAFCGSANISASKANNQEYKEISVVIDDNYPPYTFRDKYGKLQGISIDQWNLWSKKTGIKVNITGLSWDKALEEMGKGSYDVIDTIFENEDRNKLYDFSKPYAKIDVSIFFQNNISGIKDVESLSGFEVAVKKGDNSVKYLNDRGISNIKEYESYEAIVEAAKNKKVAIFVMDKPPAQYFMYKNNIESKFNYSKPLYTGEFHRAVKKGDSKLLKTVENGFSMISQNEYKIINDKWLGSSIISSKFLPYLKYAFFILLVVFLIMLFINRTLKKRVNEKTSQLLNVIEDLRRSESENKAIIKAIPDYLLILDKEGMVLDYLPTHDSDESAIWEYDILKKSIFSLLPKEAGELFILKMQQLLVSSKVQILEFNINIEEKPNFYECRMVNYANDKIFVMLRDITRKKLFDEEIYRLSNMDELTGLYNRNYFEAMMKHNNENKTGNIALVICDVDGLKLVNDTLGHNVGDEYLKDAAYVLKSTFKNGIVARIGGDEFAILIDDTTEEELIILKDKIRDDIDICNSHNKIIPISISIGYSFCDYKNKDLNLAFKEADDCMYREKIYHFQSSNSKNIEILKKMLEARDFITQDHGERLQDLAANLASSVGMTEKEIKEISLLAEFHDIGKIGIPDNILFKNGKLTNEEKEIMNRHTEIGYRIAKSSPQLIHIADWILKHHEAWNGKGYPFGIKGEEIPIQCRILSIVDAYDAMTNDRPYRKAMTKEEAINEITRCKGSQFDSILSENFITLLRN